MSGSGTLRALLRYAAGLAGVALMTVVIGVVLGRVSVANVSMLYLVVVLLSAVRLGPGPAVLASIASFLAFDWFFVEPLHTFTIAEPSEYLSLLLFLATAIVTGQLAANERRRADEARRREREAVVLYDVARLMNDADLDRALRAVAERVRLELGLIAVVVELRLDAPRRVGAGDEEAVRHLVDATAARVLGGGRAPTAARAGEAGRWIRVVPPSAHPRAGAVRPLSVPILAGRRQLGSLLLLGAGERSVSRVEDRLLSAAAAQIGTAIERSGLRREAAEAEVLRRTDELKSALLDAVSHDLRTPLASILASASSLRQRDVSWSEAEREEFLAAIEDEARRLDRLVGNLLDLSRIEAGELRPQLGWYDAGALVDDVLGHLRSVTAGHAVVARVPEDLPPVPLDYVEIDQVLSNLVENATKYSPRGTEIELSVGVVDRAVRFAVRDHGPGVPATDEDGLFTAFQRLEHRPPGVRGLGLGLAVAKRLVEAHGGRIWHERPADGGARFVFTLPMEPAR